MASIKKVSKLVSNFLNSYDCDIVKTTKTGLKLSFTAGYDITHEQFINLRSNLLDGGYSVSNIVYDDDLDQYLMYIA